MDTDAAGSAATRRPISPTILILWSLSAGGGAATAIEPPTVGSEFQVNTYTTNYQIHPAVARAPGGFVAAWASFGSSGSDSSLFSIQGQRFDPDGEPLGGQFQVNTYGGATR